MNSRGREGRNEENQRAAPNISPLDLRALLPRSGVSPGTKRVRDSVEQRKGAECGDAVKERQISPEHAVHDQSLNAKPDEPPR